MQQKISVDSPMPSSNNLQSIGFAEVDHTADWAYRVWGDTLATLFVQAAIGLYALAGIHLATDPPVVREIDLHGIDYESLLVAWLNELLYLRESENLGFNQFKILQLDPQHLTVQMQGAPVQRWSKFIKAVTYNDLSIQTTARGFETTIVMDV